MKKKELLRSVIGQLNWLCTQTRPDGSYNVLELSNMLKHSTVREILQANKTFKKLKLEECVIKFTSLGEPEDMKLVVFSDASHANLPDGHSSGAGFIIFLMGKEGKCCPLVWEAKKIKKVVKSRLAVETRALMEALDMGMYLSDTLTELFFMGTPGKKVPVECYVDNVHSTKSVTKKQLKIDLASIKHMVENKAVSKLNLIGANLQLSDCFTKSDAGTRHALRVS